MFPARIKAIYLSQSFGIVLCLASLFLLVNVFYLQTVQERKSENLDNLSQTLQEYQLKGSEAKKGENRLPTALQENFQYGRLLATALNAFKRSATEISIQKINLTEEDFTPSDSQPELTHSMARHRKAKIPEKVKRIELSGQVQSAQSAEPYSALNDVISAIKANTDCQFSLEKASADDSTAELQSQSHTSPLQFTLRLIPKTQAACFQRYQKMEETVNE